jgi:hypothetical protein
MLQDKCGNFHLGGWCVVDGRTKITKIINIIITKIDGGGGSPQTLFLQFVY